MRTRLAAGPPTVKLLAAGLLAFGGAVSAMAQPRYVQPLDSTGRAVQGSWCYVVGELPTAQGLSFVGPNGIAYRPQVEIERDVNPIVLCTEE